MHFIVLNVKTKRLDLINSKKNNDAFLKGIVGDDPELLQDIRDYLKETERKKSYGANLCGDKIAIQPCDEIWEKLIMEKPNRFRSAQIGKANPVYPTEMEFEILKKVELAERLFDNRKK